MRHQATSSPNLMHGHLQAAGGEPCHSYLPTLKRDSQLAIDTEYLGISALAP